MKKNLRFNRFESKRGRKYVKELPARRKTGEWPYSGFIKCKLVHHENYSTIIPDQIYLEAAGSLFWIQPIYFLASIVGFDEISGICRLYLDISHGASVSIEFQQDGVEAHLRDGSILYRCKLKSVRALFSYATGSARLVGTTPQIRLFHHTTEKSKRAIVSSSEFYASAWNIQGTKKLSNIRYLYLTSLEDIAGEADLQEIAMSSSGKIAFRVDQNLTPFPDEVLTVYRESTANRANTISCWVDADRLSPQHIYQHTPQVGSVYYEVVNPFIHRIGVDVDTTVPIIKGALEPQVPKLFEYVIVGDCTVRAGLRAPFDEEETEQVWKIARPPAGGDFISYWRENANTRLFDGISVERAKFQDDKGDLPAGAA